MNLKMNPFRLVSRDGEPVEAEETTATALVTADEQAEPEMVYGELVEVDEDGEPVAELVDRVHLDGPHDDGEGIAHRLRTRAAEMQPVVPMWLRSRVEVLDILRLSGELAARRAAYQVVRVPYYYLRLVGQSPRGLGRVVRVVGRWVLDWKGFQYILKLEGEDFERALDLADRRAAKLKARLMVVTAAAIVLSVAGIVVATSAPTWAQWSALGILLAALGALGGQKDKPIFTRAVVPARVEPLTSEVVVRALASTGIPELKKAAEKETGVDFKAPIMRDGPGWRAELDLPYGVTADAVIEKRKELATGLRRPLGCVWPEPVTEEHPGRLVLWVGDVELRKAKQPAWSLAKKGKVDLFDATPYGTDVRGRLVPVTLMYASVIIGSIPRMGKTFLLRLLCLIAALDPRAELHLYDLKGTGDLSPLEPVAHRYRAGDDEEDIDYAVTSMRELRQEMRRRTQVVRELPKDVCPENKVTSELADKRSLGLHPIVIAVDECQVWFEHKEYGAELEEICTDLVKRGPALGIVTMLATQRPDKGSIPPGISANAVLRFALKVMGHIENDMVLGSGTNKAGYKAQTFSRKDLGIHYLGGEGDDPRIVRSVYVDAPTAEQIARRARELREEAGTLSGHALGQEPAAGPSSDLLADLLAVTAAKEERLWNSVAVDRLVDLRPEAYGQWSHLPDEEKTAMLTAALKPFGIATQDTAGRLADSTRANRKGFKRSEVLEVHTQRGRAKARV